MKNLKNFEIENLVNAGVLTLTTNTLSSADAYVVFKFRKAVRAAMIALEENRREALVEAGIEDGPAFEKRRKELSDIAEPTEEQRAELAELNSKFNKFTELVKALYDDEVTFPTIKPISFDSWHTLITENKASRINAYIEELLENVLWAEPEE